MSKTDRITGISTRLLESGFRLSDLGQGGHRRVTDALPMQGEPEWRNGARLVASFHGPSFTAEKTEDGVRVVRGGDGGVNQRGAPIAFFEGTDRWRAEPSDNGRGLQIYEVDPHHLGLDVARPRTIVQGSARDTRAHAQQTLREIQRRNVEFWACENRKLTEGTEK